MITRARVVEAKYKKTGVKDLDGNPFTEALSAFYSSSPNSAAEILLEIPEDYWELPDFARRSIITNLRSFFKPNEMFSTLYKSIFNLAFHSYSHRNPLNSDVIRNKMAFAKNAREINKFNAQETRQCIQRTTALTILVYGLSGTGKTTSIRHALGLIPQVISHSHYENQQFKQEQLVWVSIDMPATPSIKALAANFYEAVDKALGTDYLAHWAGGKNIAVDRHLLAMQQIAQTHDIGVIHIDELQWLLRYARSPNAPTLAILEALFNKIGIPVIMSCTTAGLKLFQSDANGGSRVPDFTITRRMVSDTEIAFSEIRKNSRYYNELFLLLFPECMCKFDERTNESFKQYFYYLTFGIPDILARLAYVYHCTIDVLYQKGVLENYNAMQLLENVFNKDFVQISKALDLLRNGQIEDYERTLPQTQAPKTQSNAENAAHISTEKPVATKKQRKGNPVALTYAENIPVGLG